MSDDFEDYLRSQTLKEPSADLDDRVLSLFDVKEENQIKAFPWQKFATYAVAAMLFLSIGVTEFIQRSQEQNNSTVQTPSENHFSNDSSIAVPTMKVSTSGSVENEEPLKKKSLSR